MEAFRDLETCRPEPGRWIPWTAIRDYAVAKGVEDTERFERLIRSMDAEALTRRLEGPEDKKRAN